MDIICAKCGVHLNNIEDCRNHVGHCEMTPKGEVPSFLPARGSKMTQAEWGELLGFVSSLKMNALPTSAPTREKIAKLGVKTAKPGIFLTVMGIIMLLGSVALIWYFAYLNTRGYQVGILVVLAWGLCFFSLGCFAWVKRRFLPLILYGICAFWFLIVGGENRWAYTVPYVLVFGTAFLVALFTMRKRKGKVGEIAKLQPTSVANSKQTESSPSTQGIICPNPKCQSRNIRVVGKGIYARNLCGDCGLEFGMEE